MDEKTELETHLKIARHVLAMTLAEGNSFAPMILVMRGGRLVAQIIPPRDVDTGAAVRRTSRIAAEGYRADVIVVISDSYVATDLINPVTGKRWQHGQMEEVAQKMDGVERGWVCDALNVVFNRRSGMSSVITMPYRVKDGAPVWLPEERFDSDDTSTHEISGRITGMLEPLGIFDNVEVTDEVVTEFLTLTDAVVMSMDGQTHASDDARLN